MAPDGARTEGAPALTLVENVRLATLAVADRAPAVLEDGALLIRGDRIAWIGPRPALPPGAFEGARIIDAGARWATPGLIDCHTHLVFGGDRAGEFRRRIEGVGYEEIARAGGGILSTVRATRAADEESLAAQAGRRLRRLAAGGVTSVEIKSGYGLDLETELRMLRAARALGESHPVSVTTTLLGAHALPPEYEGRRAAYIDMVVEELVPAAAEAGLADAVDAFCEGIAFSAAECRRVLRAGRLHGLALRLHADQLSDAGGAALAAEMGARSADHLEYTSEAGAKAMASAGTVAVLLPGAFYFLGETQAPPVDAFRRLGVPMALATDCNPGSSPVLSPTLVMNLACVLFRLSPEEALAGMTRVAARVLGQEEDRGTLEVGKRADVAFWNVAGLDELAYWAGGEPCAGVMQGGRMVAELH